VTKLAALALAEQAIAMIPIEKDASMVLVRSARQRIIENFQSQDAEVFRFH